jgi:putative adhesin
MTTTTTGSSLEHVIGLDGIVKIRLRAGEIRLQGVDGETVHVRDRGGDELAAMFSIDLGQGSIDLSDGGDHQRHGHAPELEIELPRRATLVVETTNAEIAGDELLGDQRYRTTSGDMTLRAVGGQIAIDDVSGDLDIVATGEAEMTIKTVSGDVAIRAGTLRALRATTTSGDLKVAGRLAGPGPFAVETVSGDLLLAPAGDVAIEMTTMSGDLTSDLGERARGGRGRRSLVIGTGGPSLTYRSMSGDLHVVRPVPVPVPAAPAAPSAPGAPMPAVAPVALVEPVAPAAVANGAIAAAYEDARLRILRALERGEIDVAEAGRRFEALDAADPADPSSDTTRVLTVDRSDA